MFKLKIINFIEKIDNTIIYGEYESYSDILKYRNATHIVTDIVNINGELYGLFDIIPTLNGLKLKRLIENNLNNYYMKYNKNNNSLNIYTKK